jgi:hypothetical protein
MKEREKKDNSLGENGEAKGLYAIRHEATEISFADASNGIHISTGAVVFRHVSTQTNEQRCKMERNEKEMQATFHPHSLNPKPAGLLIVLWPTELAERTDRPAPSSV